jgi:hypothetical protein
MPFMRRAAVEKAESHPRVGSDAIFDLRSQSGAFPINACVYETYYQSTVSDMSTVRGKFAPRWGVEGLDIRFEMTDLPYPIRKLLSGDATDVRKILDTTKNPNGRTSD